MFSALKVNVLQVLIVKGQIVIARLLKSENLKNRGVLWGVFCMQWLVPT